MSVSRSPLNFLCLTFLFTAVLWVPALLRLCVCFSFGYCASTSFAILIRLYAAPTR